MKKAVRKILGCTLVVSLLASLCVTAGMLSASAVTETDVVTWGKDTYQVANSGVLSDSTHFEGGKTITWDAESGTSQWNYSIVSWAADQKALQANDTLKVTIYSEDMKAPTAMMCLNVDDKEYYNSPATKYTLNSDTTLEFKYSEFKNGDVAFDASKYTDKNVKVMLMFRPNGDEAIANNWSVDFTNVTAYNSADVEETEPTEPSSETPDATDPSSEGNTDATESTTVARPEGDKLVSVDSLVEETDYRNEGMLANAGEVTIEPSDAFGENAGVHISASFPQQTDWKDYQFSVLPSADKNPNFAAFAQYKGFKLDAIIDSEGDTMDSAITVKLTIDGKIYSATQTVLLKDTPQTLYFMFDEFQTDSKELLIPEGSDDYSILAGVTKFQYIRSKWVGEATDMNVSFAVSDVIGVDEGPTTATYGDDPVVDDSGDNGDDSWNDGSGNDDSNSGDTGYDDGYIDNTTNPGTGVAAPIGVALLAGVAGAVVLISKKRK